MLNNILHRNEKYDQNYFIPKNKDKCINYNDSKKIIYRSSWEKRFMNFCDMNKKVIKWGSETISIPYIYDIDQKVHNYYPDFYLEMLNKDGKKVKYLIEIKPKKQMNIPQIPKRKTKKAMNNYNYAKCEYIKNKNKWKSANSFCDVRNIKFRILNEDILF